MSPVRDLLGADGPLARELDGFAPRAEQQALAEAVDRALAGSGALVGEAGTGVGKTFAYLVPALRRGGKVIISTGTRHLQDQLFHSDLPRVRRALGVPARVALLKGRSNYLCLHRLALADGVPLTRRADLAAQLDHVRSVARHSDSGDIAEIGAVPEDSPLWPYVTSTTDNCLGRECPAYNDCFVLKARRRAQEAEVVVVNHHLL
ncbi:MAG: ATP-dependent DNA helicase, partial [Halofilum sp. (in: g-proteobacteria)]|nr:ATP-dependent DNA helicase [Halofilum sp. (in: g-proteobacteria)]